MSQNTLQNKRKFPDAQLCINGHADEGEKKKKYKNNRKRDKIVVPQNLDISQ